MPCLCRPARRSPRRAAAAVPHVRLRPAPQRSRKRSRQRRRSLPSKAMKVPCFPRQQSNRMISERRRRSPERRAKSAEKCRIRVYSAAAGAAQIVLVADVFEQLTAAAVDELPDREVAHCMSRRRAVPMRHAGRRPNDVAGPDFALLAASLLYPADAGRHDEVLSGRMVVPRGMRARARTSLRRPSSGYSPLPRTIPPRSPLPCTPAPDRESWFAPRSE